MFGLIFDWFLERCLLISGWFYFAIRKSTEESKFYINHCQDDGLGDHDDIQKESPISCSNSWKKEFLLKFWRHSRFEKWYFLNLFKCYSIIWRNIQGLGQKYETRYRKMQNYYKDWWPEYFLFACLWMEASKWG